MYQNITEGYFKFFDEKLSKSTSTYNLDPALYTSITDIVEAMNTLVQERNNHNETCITVKVPRRTQKVVIMLANDTSGLAFCSTVLGHTFGNNVGNQFGVLMKGKGPHEPQFAYDIVRIHSLMIYGDLVEYKIIGDTNIPLLRCSPFISKLKGKDIITTGQYMNYQTFSNLQFRPLLKKSSHCIHIDLRNTSDEKTPFVSVGITRLVLMFRKVSGIHFQHIQNYKMVVSRQVEIPYYRAVGRQRGRRFGALAQVIGRTAIPFLRKYVVPAAKRVGADLLEFAVPQMVEVVSGRKYFKTAAKSVGKQTVRKHLREGSKKRTASRIIPTKSTEQSSCSRRDIFCKFFSLIMSSNFRYQPFVAVSGNLGRKVPFDDDVLSLHEHEIYPTTSRDENCVEFEFQTDRNFYVDLRQSFLPLKLKFVKGRGYDTYESKEKKKEHKDESVVFTETGTDDKEEEEVARVTYVNNIMQSIFSNVEVFIINQQIYNSNGLYAHKSYISNNFKAAIFEYKNTREFCIVKVMTMNRILRILITP